MLRRIGDEAKRSCPVCGRERVNLPEPTEKCAFADFLRCSFSPGFISEY